jgi:uncharacterized membrane protein YdjX (TVP38/TMEM64 family)
MAKKKNLIIPLITLTVIVGLIALLCVMLVPILADIFTAHDGRNAIEIIHSHGARGIPLLACLQALQVITTVVPAMLIQIPAGLVFGTWNGLLICLAGSILGNMIVFIALRQFSTTIDSIFPSRREKREKKAQRPKKKRRLPFFLNPESLDRMPHPELVAFYVYLIPGIPNGVLPHIFARTKVSFARYLMAVVAGNAPSTLVCTLVGDCLAHGNWQGAVIIILVFAGCIGLALLLRRKLITLISGGYSLSLGRANGKRAEADAPAEAAAEAGKVAVAAAEASKVAAAAAEAGKVAVETAGDAPDGKSTGAADREEAAATRANDDGDQPPAGAADPGRDTAPEDDAPDEMQAVGTHDIAPHGWRILKGSKK